MQLKERQLKSTVRTYVRRGYAAVVQIKFSEVHERKKERKG
jgi:DNA-binding winged helix-turn-helix (wHTH) protein